MPRVTTHRSFCRLCVASCGMLVETDGDHVVEVRGDPTHPLSRGYLCPKGRALGAAHHDPRRLDRSLLGRPPARRPTPADEVLDDLADRLRHIIDESGPDAVGVYAGTFGSMDSTGRIAVQGLQQALGTRSVYSPWTIDSIAKPAATQLMSGRPLLFTHVTPETRCTIFVGSNPVVSHGHLWALPDPVRRLRELARDGEVWVLDPRRTETARLATHHLAPSPGTDHAVFAHLVRALLRDGADEGYMEAHTTGIAALRAAVEPYTTEVTAGLTRLAPEQLAELVAAVRRAGRLAILTATGTLFSAAATVTEWLVWATLLVTGSLDRPGGMLCNTDAFSPADPAAFAPAPRAPAPGPPSRPELPSWLAQYPVAAMCDEIEAGNLRALLVVGGNPWTAFPDHDRTTRALRSLEVLAVADVIAADTTIVATHVLACAGLLERAELSSSSLQELNYGEFAPAVFTPAGERHPAWWYLAQLGRRLGVDVMPVDPDTARDEDVLAANTTRPEIAERIRVGRPFSDLGDVRYGAVSETFRQDPWDLAPERLVRRLAELDAARSSAPLVFLPRRQPRHTNAFLRDVPAPGGRTDDAVVYVHPSDAAAAGVHDGDPARIETQHGSLLGTVRFDPELVRGAIAVPHGHASMNVSRLTSGTAVDPLSGMTVQSGIPVTLAPVRA